MACARFLRRVSRLILVLFFSSFLRSPFTCVTPIQNTHNHNLASHFGFYLHMHTRMPTSHVPLQVLAIGQRCRAPPCRAGLRAAGQTMSMSMSPCPMSCSMHATEYALAQRSSYGNQPCPPCSACGTSIDSSTHCGHERTCNTHVTLTLINHSVSDCEFRLQQRATSWVPSCPRVGLYSTVHSVQC